VLTELKVANLPLNKRAMPSMRGCRFESISSEDADAVAARTRRDVVYIGVDTPHIDGDSATISLGVDFAPADKSAVKMCCCTSRAEFRRRTGRWTFVKWTGTTCS
jgi:hypothetical protein